MVSDPIDAEVASHPVYSHMCKRKQRSSRFFHSLTSYWPWDLVPKKSQPKSWSVGLVEQLGSLARDWNNLREITPGEPTYFHHLKALIVKQIRLRVYRHYRSTQRKWALVVSDVKRVRAQVNLMIYTAQTRATTSRGYSIEETSLNNADDQWQEVLDTQQSNEVSDVDDEIGSQDEMGDETEDSGDFGSHASMGTHDQEVDEVANSVGNTHVLPTPQRISHHMKMRHGQHGTRRQPEGMRIQHPSPRRLRAEPTVQLSSPTPPEAGQPLEIELQRSFKPLTAKLLEQMEDQRKDTMADLQMAETQLNSLTEEALNPDTGHDERAERALAELVVANARAESAGKALESLTRWFTPVTEQEKSLVERHVLAARAARKDKEAAEDRLTEATVLRGTEQSERAQQFTTRVNELQLRKAALDDHTEALRFFQSIVEAGPVAFYQALTAENLVSAVGTALTKHSRIGEELEGIQEDADIWNEALSPL